MDDGLPEYFDIVEKPIEAVGEDGIPVEDTIDELPIKDIDAAEIGSEDKETTGEDGIPGKVTKDGKPIKVMPIIVPDFGIETKEAEVDDGTPD